MLRIGSGESLEIEEDESLLGIEKLENDGRVFGAGTIGLDWREPITGSAPFVTCAVTEENPPRLEPEAAAELTAVRVVCRTVGAVRYELEWNGSRFEMTPGDAETVRGHVPISDSAVDYRITIRAVNSRGNAVCFEISISVYAGSARYTVTKNLFPLQAFSPLRQITFAARIAEKGTGALLSPDSVARVTWTRFREIKNVSGTGRVKIGNGEEEISPVPLAGVLSLTPEWRRDRIGGNFYYTPSETAGEFLGEKGVFDVVFTVRLANGADIRFGWSILTDPRAVPSS